MPLTGHLGFGKENAVFGVPSELLEQLVPSVCVAIAMMIVMHFCNEAWVYVVAPILAIALTAATWTAVVWYSPELPLILDWIMVVLIWAFLTFLVGMLRIAHLDFLRKNRETKPKKASQPMAASSH